jgi:hypothetical protein
MATLFLSGSELAAETDPSGGRAVKETVMIELSLATVAKLMTTL